MSENTPAKRSEFLPTHLNAQQIASIVADNIGDGANLSAFDLERITIPGSGGKAWTLPDGSAAPTFTGVIMAWHNCRGFWAKPFAGGTPPNCSSMDGLTGHGEPGGACATCKLAQWGSGRDSSGQACKAMRRLFILLPGQLMPVLLTLPPTSLKPCQRYMLKLTSAQIPFWAAVTEFGLVQTKSQGSIAYSVADFTIKHELPPEEAQAVRALATSMAGLLKAPVSGDDYAGEAREVDV